MSATLSSPDATLAAHAAELHDALAELVRVYQFRDRDKICCHDVSVTQCHALEALVGRGPLRLGELAAELFLDKSTASRVVGTLERKGYVERAPHPEDARAVQLAATAAGRALCGRIQGDLEAETRELIRDLAPEVRLAAAELLRRLTRATRSRAGLAQACDGPVCCAAPPPATPG